MCYRACMQNTPMKLLGGVVLWGDKPEEGLAAGQVGTVVEVLAPGIFEVEFLDSHGRTAGLAELKREELLALKYEAAVQCRLPWAGRVAAVPHVRDLAA